MTHETPRELFLRTHRMLVDAGISEKEAISLAMERITARAVVAQGYEYRCAPPDAATLLPSR